MSTCNDILILFDYFVLQSLLKIKSSHDVLKDDPKLSSVPVIEDYE